MGIDMRKLIIALLVLALPTWSFAGSQQIRQVVGMAKVQSGSALDCTGWTLCEDFEGTGAPASMLSETGTPDYDATPPSAMEADEALLLDAYTDSSDRITTLSITDTVGQDDSLLRFRFMATAMGDTSGSDIIIQWMDGGLSICTVSVTDLGTTTYSLKTQSNTGTTGTISDSLTIGTVYYVWARLIEGTADNAECSIAFNTTDSEPTSGTKFASSTGGTVEGSLDRIQFVGNYTSASDRWDVYFDAIQAKGNQ